MPLRTPLTSVLANLELLQASLGGPGQAEDREIVDSALRSSKRMSRLVSDLLLLARADAGRLAPHGRAGAGALARLPRGGIGLAAGLTEPTAGLGAVGGYAGLHGYTALGGQLTVFSLPDS